MSSSTEKIVHNPIFFERNRIYRVYRGGEMFQQLFSDPPENTLYPEEWIASAVKALGTPHDDIPDYGISKIKDTTIPFSSVLKEYPRELLGDGKEFNIFALPSDFNQNPAGVTHRDHIVANLNTGTMNWRWAYLGMWDDAYTLPVDYSCAYNVGNAFNDLDQVVEGVGFTYLNPQFMNPAGDDYRVADGSPCDGTAHDGTDMGAYGGSDPLTWLPD